MSAQAITVTDKDRLRGMQEDGEWDDFSIKGLDGDIRPDILLPDGTYICIVALHGQILEEPESDLEVRGQRYPSLDSTGWSVIPLKNRVDPGVWFGTFTFKIVIQAGSTVSSIAERVGIDYRVRGGALKIEHVILKFLRQADDTDG